MKNYISLKNQFFQLFPTVIISITLGLLGIIGVYVLSHVTGTPISKLTRDPAAVNNTKFYIGILSNLGIILWSAATAICLLAAAFLIYNVNNQAGLFLLCSGFLSLLLTLDDAFQFHEGLLPNHLHLPESGIYIGYVIIVAIYLLYFVRRILMTDYLLLLFALVFLGMSAAADRFLPFGNRESFFEDSLKFIGIIFWLAYFAHAAARLIHDAFPVEREG